MTMETTATMPKMKTHSGTAKRFRITGGGKVMRRRANMNHLLEHKASSEPGGWAKSWWLTPQTRRRSRRCWGSSPARLQGDSEMARVKRAVNAHKKRRVVLERASGYRGQRSRLYRKAKEQVLHSMTYAYRDRKDRKGDFRRLWIQRINAAARADGITYNRFIQGLRLAEVEVDRRMLAELAVSDPASFSALVEVAKAALAEAGPDADTAAA